MKVLKLYRALALLFAVACGFSISGSHAQPAGDAQVLDPGEGVLVHYLEIVTPDVDATCSTLEALHGVTFGAPDAALGNARTADLNGGGMIGVRAPMHDGEHPVVRPYVLVDDIESAVKAAESAGAQIIVPPMDLPGHGKCAIYVVGGIQHGLWQQ